MPQLHWIWLVNLSRLIPGRHTVAGFAAMEIFDIL
jgi:hypothetical protein